MDLCLLNGFWWKTYEFLSGLLTDYRQSNLTRGFPVVTNGSSS